LPDGIFSNQKSKFGSILEGLEMEDVGIFYIWSYETSYALWYGLCSFGNVVIIWYIFHRFGILSDEKSGNPVFGIEYGHFEGCYSRPT
jgi:hypothetical protein